MPAHDWQFWLVTLLAAVGLWLILRPLLPRKTRRGKRVSLTISGRPQR